MNKKREKNDMKKNKATIVLSLLSLATTSALVATSVLLVQATTRPTIEEIEKVPTSVSFVTTTGKLWTIDFTTVIQLNVVLTDTPSWDWNVTAKYLNPDVPGALIAYDFGDVDLPQEAARIKRAWIAYTNAKEAGEIQWTNQKD